MDINQVSARSVGVALATHNGEKFLHAQLASIFAQSRLPDAIVIVDDASTDGTIEIIKTFMRECNVNVRLIHHHKNLGSSLSFKEAIIACDTDVIFLCDQDDIWLHDKIETMLCLKNRFQADIVFSNSMIFQDTTGRCKGTMFDSLSFTKDEIMRVVGGSALNVLLKKNVITGASMAFSSKVKQYLTQLNASTPHDYYIGLVGAYYGLKFAVLTRSLSLYRQHQHQVTGAPRGVIRGLKNRYSSVSASLDTLTALGLEVQEDKNSSKPEWCLVKVYSMHLCARRSILSRKRVVRRIIAEVISLRYFTLSNGLRTLIGDLLG